MKTVDCYDDKLLNTCG